MKIENLFSLNDLVGKDMEKLLIIGAGGFGRIVLEHARQEYECSFIDDGVSVGTEICGCKVIGATNDLQNLFSDYKKAVVAIGNNILREKLYQEAKKIGFNIPNIICSSVYCSPYSKIGEGCVFLNNVVVQNGSFIGNGVILNPGVEIHHDCKVGNFVLIYANSVIRALAEIGDRAWIGSNLSVSNGMKVCEDTIIENGKTI